MPISCRCYAVVFGKVCVFVYCVLGIKDTSNAKMEESVRRVVNRYLDVTKHVLITFSAPKNFYATIVYERVRRKYSCVCFVLVVENKSLMQFKKPTVAFRKY